MNKLLMTDNEILEKSTTTACNNYRIERDTGLLLGDEDQKMCIESYKAVQNKGFAGGRRKRTRSTKRKSKKARKTRRKKTKRSRK